MPGLKQAWPTSGGLLIAGDARDRQRRTKQLGSVVPYTSLLSRTAGNSAAGTRNRSQQFLVPGLRVDVVEQRARGIGGVGRVHAPPVRRHSSQRVDGAEGELAGCGALPARPGT